MILILYVQVDIQTSYGQQQPPLPSLRIKVQMDKAVIAQGNTQTIEFQVSDEMTHQPIGGGVISVLVRYPDVRTVRQFTVTTDTLGHPTVSWKIEDNAPLGTFAVFTEYLKQDIYRLQALTTHLVWYHIVLINLTAINIIPITTIRVR